MTESDPARSDAVDDRTFAALRDDSTSPVTPDDRFVTSLRRRIEAELGAASTGDDPEPSVDFPPRKDRTVPTGDSNTTTSTPVVEDPPTAQQIITPYISVHDGPGALDWYVAALGATESVRYVGDDGRLGHAEFRINGATVMLSDAYPEIGVVAANSYEGSSCALHVEVADCDAVYAKAVELGATSQQEPAQQPHGSRMATIVDPYGHRWMLSQTVSSPTIAEIDAAYDDFTIVEPD